MAALAESTATDALNLAREHSGDLLELIQLIQAKADPLQPGSVGTALLADAAVTLAKMAYESVGHRQLIADAVRSGHVADAAIIAAHIAGDQILTRHIAADQVTQGELAGASVGGPELIDEAVSEGKLDAAVKAKPQRSGRGR